LGKSAQMHEAAIDLMSSFGAIATSQDWLASL
jgi:hypothetical protein